MSPALCFRASLGRKLGPAMLERPAIRSWSVTSTRQQTLVARRGWWALVVARFTALLRALVPFAAGMDRTPYRRFLLESGEQPPEPESPWCLAGVRILGGGFLSACLSLVSGALGHDA